MMETDDMGALARSAAMTCAWLLCWTALMLLASVVLSGCSSVEWRRTAEFCEALSPVLRAMSECM